MFGFVVLLCTVLLMYSSGLERIGIDNVPEQKATIADNEQLTNIPAHTTQADNIEMSTSMPVIGRLQSRTNRSEGRPPGYLFFKHIRKAGGTSVRSYIAKVLWHLQEQASSKIVPRFFEQEFGTMDRNCPRIDPRWNRTLSIIVMRNPLERHISEFFYSGPGSKGELATLYKQGRKARKFTDRFFDLVQRELPGWIESGNDIAQARKSTLTRSFVNHYQTLALAGKTDNVPSRPSAATKCQNAPKPTGNHNCQRECMHGINEGCSKCRGGCVVGPCMYGQG